MPKVGMEAIRRKALIAAALEEIGVRGGLDVTVSQIARRAGVSAALAHHYFGNKEQILTASMRFLLREYGDQTRARLRAVQTPRERLSAIVVSSLGGDQFRDATVTAWLALYAEARRSKPAYRLLEIYVRRLRSNLVFALKPLTSRPETLADMIGATIDGLYLRHALRKGRAEPAAAMAMVESMIDSYLANDSKPEGPEMNRPVRDE
jgi:TetR/AcrR family transcriptional repressor of bet genes